MTALTPIGQRTLTGFKQKYGDKVGTKKFNEAMNAGLLDRSKMENVFITGSTDQQEAGSPEEAAAVDQAVNKGGIQGLDSVTSRKETPPNPTKPGKRRIPTGVVGMVGRGARGSFQSRPG